jgi:hypothetical protein
MNSRIAKMCNYKTQETPLGLGKKHSKWAKNELGINIMN